MNTNQLDPAGLSGAINIQDLVTAAGAVNIRNNIFVSTQTAGAQRYAIISESPNTVFGVIDYNDYFTLGPNLGIIQGVNTPDLPLYKLDLVATQILLSSIQHLFPQQIYT